MSKVINSAWYASSHCIGIVQVVQDHQMEQYRQTGDAEYKYYIGVGLGVNKKADELSIAEYGMPFDVIAGNALFGVTPTRFIG
jgi:hypothetical protein